MVPVLLPKTVAVATPNNTRTREATRGFVNHLGRLGLAITVDSRRVR